MYTKPWHLTDQIPSTHPWHQAVCVGAKLSPSIYLPWQRLLHGQTVCFLSVSTVWVGSLLYTIYMFFPSWSIPEGWSLVKIDLLVMNLFFFSPACDEGRPTARTFILGWKNKKNTVLVKLYQYQRIWSIHQDGYTVHIICTNLCSFAPAPSSKHFDIDASIIYTCTREVCTYS